MAKQLGVEAMSLYHHVDDRDDLLDGLAEVMVSSGLAPPPPGTPPQALMAGFARGVRATALAHPDAFRLVGLRPLRSPAAAGAVTTLLAALGSAGIEPDRAVAAYRTLAAYARGYALSEIEGLTFGPGVDSPLPTELEPYGDALGQDTETMFERGLDAIIRGFEPTESPPRRS